jgi:CRP-like cAMP-binding protein
MSYDAFLKQVPLFAELPDQDLEQLCQMVWDVTLDSDETLFYEGDEGDKAYVIKEGELDIVKRAPGGREVLLAVLKVGDILGEMALLESTPRTATVRARTDARLLVITDHGGTRLKRCCVRAKRWRS